MDLASSHCDHQSDSVLSGRTDLHEGRSEVATLNAYLALILKHFIQIKATHCTWIFNWAPTLPIKKMMHDMPSRNSIITGRKRFRQRLRSLKEIPTLGVAKLPRSSDPALSGKDVVDCQASSPVCEAVSHCVNYKLMAWTGHVLGGFPQNENPDLKNASKPKEHWNS